MDNLTRLKSLSDTIDFLRDEKNRLVDTILTLPENAVLDLSDRVMFVRNHLGKADAAQYYRRMVDPKMSVSEAWGYVSKLPENRTQDPVKEASWTHT